jgi:hypothetical protein
MAKCAGCAGSNGQQPQQGGVIGSGITYDPQATTGAHPTPSLEEMPSGDRLSIIKRSHRISSSEYCWKIPVSLLLSPSLLIVVVVVVLLLKSSPFLISVRSHTIRYLRPFSLPFRLARPFVSITTHRTLIIHHRTAISACLPLELASPSWIARDRGQFHHTQMEP